MFLCQKCHKKEQLTRAGLHLNAHRWSSHIFKSTGPCEGCKCHAECVDCRPPLGYAACTTIRRSQERDRRAACFPELVAALESIRNQVTVYPDGNAFSRNQTVKTIDNIAEAALAKAKN